MSLKVTGPLVLSSPSNAYAASPSLATISCRVRIDPASATPATGATVFGRSSGQGFRVLTGNTFFAASTQPSIRLQMFPTSGGALTYEFNYVPGRAYHLVGVWNGTGSSQSVYLDGRLVASWTSSLALQSAGTSTFQVGASNQAAGAIAFVDDCYFWAGVAATAGDVAALRDRSVLPTAYSPANLVWGVPLEGTDGATVTAGDPGLVDAAAGRNLVPSGSGSAVWSSDTLAYTPQMATSARVLESGRTIAFFFADSVSGGPAYPSVNGANPTISINGGSPVTLTTPVVSNVVANANLPFFLYALPSTLSPTDVVTFSAPDGWASVPTPGNSAYPVVYAGPSSGVEVANGSGRPNFTAATPTMKIGFNLTGGSYYTLARNSRNLIRQCTSWGNVSAFDSNGKPTTSSTAWFAIVPPTGQPDGVDSLNQPGTAAVPWMPYNNDRYTLVWDEASPANNSALKITNSLGASSDVSVTIAERTDLAVDPPDGIGRTRVFQVTRPPGATNYALGLNVRGSRLDWTDLRLYGPGNRVDPTKFADEVLAAYCRGANVVRPMTALATNGSFAATRDHLRPTTDFTYGYSRPYWVTLAGADPVANVADFAFSDGWMAATVTTATPHGLYTGQNVAFQNVANQTFSFAVSLGADVVSTTATSITLASNAGIRLTDLLLIDSEWMQVSAVSGDGVTLTVTRKAAGSTAATHASGTAGVCYPQAIFAADGVTRAGMSSVSASIFVTSPTTFECMMSTGTSIGTSTTNAYPAQTLMPIGQVGATDRTRGMPYEHAFRMCSEMGVDCWINVPFGATDDCAQAIAEMARDNLTPGLKVWAEFSNEIWNTGPGFRAQSLGAIFLGAKSGLTAAQWAAKRTGEVHAIFEDVLAAAGRPDDLVRVYGSLISNPAWTSQMAAYCAANGTRIDAVAVSPYINMPAAWSSATNAYDTDMLHDLWQLYLTHGSPWNTARPEGYNPQQKAALAASFPDAKLVSYEGSLQVVVPVGATNYVARSHDFRYHPRMYDTMTAFFSSLQNGGQDTFCFFQVEDGGGWANLNGAWAMYFWHGQQWGYGDGSDGKANNLDCLAATKPSTVQQDYQNVSVMGQAFKDWSAAAALNAEDPPVPNSLDYFAAGEPLANPIQGTGWSLDYFAAGEPLSAIAPSLPAGPTVAVPVAALATGGGKLPGPLVQGQPTPGMGSTTRPYAAKRWIPPRRSRSR